MCMCMYVSEILGKYNLNHLMNLSSLYLCGHRTINLTDNRKILLSTINYINVVQVNTTIMRISI